MFPTASLFFAALHSMSSSWLCQTLTSFHLSTLPTRTYKHYTWAVTTASVGIHLFVYYVHGVFACMCICTAMYRGQKSVLSPGTGVTDGCELLYGHWESNRDPLEEQSVCSLPLSCFTCPDLAGYSGGVGVI